MTPRPVTAVLVGVLAALTALLTAPTAAGDSWNQATVQGAPRLQWNANYGYCGETSLITAGLRYGQYTSQWTARALASPGIPQTRADSQLLLGENDLVAAQAMHLDASRAPRTRSFPEFTTWIRNQVVDGHSVIVGMFNNTRMLGEEGPGDATYDHIVPIYGYESVSTLSGPAPSRDSDVITISDNGLRTIGAQYPMLYSYRLSDIQRNRHEANAPGGPVYAFPRKGPWYGLEVSGVADGDQQALGVTVAVNRRGEGLQNQPVLSRPPDDRPITLTVTVDRPADGSAVVLYQYDDFASVPDRAYNAHAGDAARSWQVPAGTGPWTVTVPARSSDTRVFRATRVQAP